jgi:hypothetical protein
MSVELFSTLDADADEIAALVSGFIMTSIQVNLAEKRPWQIKSPKFAVTT